MLRGTIETTSSIQKHDTEYVKVYPKYLSISHQQLVLLKFRFYRWTRNLLYNNTEKVLLYLHGY